MADRIITRRSGKVRHAQAVAADAGLVWKRIGWLAVAAAWLFAATSLLGFDPSDAPALGIAPHNEPARNFCGKFGAVASYYGFEYFGLGLWVLVALGAVLLYFTASGKRVGHLGIRLLGGLLMTASVAALQAVMFPDSGPVRPLGGGLIGTVAKAELLSRFNTMGTLLWIAVAFAIGATVALDVWALIAAVWAGRVMGGAVRVAGRRGGQLAAQLAEMRENARENARQVEVRLNDVDDDEELPGRATRKAATSKRAAVAQIEDEEEIEVEREAVATPAGTKKGRQAAAATIEEDTEDAEEIEADASDIEGDSGETDEDLPGAPQIFDPEALRLKMAKLPVVFASVNKRSATEEDLRDIQNSGEMEGYRFPGLDLLEDPEVNYSITMDAYVREQAGALERALKEYRIDGEVVGIESGPVITLYEVKLAPGTKVAALAALSSDLARSLKAVNIRIVPNTVGRDTVGIEVPNAHKEKVRLKELMTKLDQAGGGGKMRLPMFLGKDASGQPLIEDLTQMPHLLIAGTTGSGKSVCMNTVIMSFLYTKKPNELKLVLVDPKMVELSQFKDIPHLMCPVVTEMGKATAILEWAVGKMDERYELLAEAGCRDIAAYNELPWEELKERFDPQSPEEEAKIPRKLPYMVFIVDELADLIMTNKEVEHSIVRIAQKARAVGIHLIVATQRPQANVVTGLIKSNMPGRISFKVASGMDSRIVLDQKGGELLLGQGDMLYLSPRSHKMMRAQGTLVDDKEIRRVVKFMREVAAPTFERQLMQIKSGASGLSEDEQRDGFINAQEDPMFDQAVEIVLETKRGSVSMLQRRLAIGYTRAARLVEMMGEAGILGSHKGTVAREVAMTLEEWHAMKAQAVADAAAGGTEQGELFKEPGQSAATQTSLAPARKSLQDVIAGAEEGADEDPFEDAFQDAEEKKEDD